MTLDLAVFNFLHGLSGFSFYSDFFIIFLANYLGYFFIIVAIYLIFSAKEFSEKFYRLVLVSLPLILGWGVISKIISFLYPQPRPYKVLGFVPLFSNLNDFASFPSLHAVTFFALGLSIWFLNKKQGTFALIGAVLISLARVAAGVHWPFDILTGAIIGLTSALLVKYLLAPIEKKRGKDEDVLQVVGR